MVTLTGDEVLFDFGGAMKRLRTKKGLTRGDIFRATGLERPYLSKFENNKIRYPRIRTIYRIAEAMDVTLDEFIREAMDGAVPKK